MINETIEKLADLEHVQWQKWAKSVSGDIQALLDIINNNISLDDLDRDQLAIIEKTAERIARWSELMIDYSELSEDMKERDRKYARMSYEICRADFE